MVMTTPETAISPTYAGLNYYIRGHQLKLMSGVKYSYLGGTPNGDGFDGWTFMTGVRMAF